MFAAMILFLMIFAVIIFFFVRIFVMLLSFLIRGDESLVLGNIVSVFGTIGVIYYIYEYEPDIKALLIAAVVTIIVLFIATCVRMHSLGLKETIRERQDAASAAAYTERRRREREQARIEKDAEDEIEMDFEVRDSDDL